MARKPEQIDKGERSPVCKKFLKKEAKRLRRRQEKEDAENAPKKIKYHGYSM